MRLGNLSISNFQSYASLEFDYRELGLTLISGETGAGKSTLLDAPCWILFGATSKDSAADDVRSWGADSVTEGTVDVETATGRISVTRVRGKSSSQNDLYWIECDDPDNKRRGKDLSDTLKLIESRIGVTSDLYMSGAYMHQFSTAEQFFIAKAKDRREALERIVDLTLPVTLSEAASEDRKKQKKAIEASQLTQSKLQGSLEAQIQELRQCELNAKRWEESKSQKLKLLNQKSADFEAFKFEKIEALLEGLKALDAKIKDQEKLQAEEANYSRQLKQMAQVRVDHKAAQGKALTAAITVKNLESEIQKYSGDLDTTCPTCLGQTDPSHRQKHVAELESKLAKALETKRKADAVFSACDAALQTEPKLQRAHREASLKCVENMRVHDQIEAEKNKLAVASDEVNPYPEQIETLETEACPFDSRIESIQASIEKLDADIKKLSKATAETENRLAASDLLYDLSFQLRGRLIAQAVSELNQSTNDLLERHFDAPLRVKFEVSGGDKIEVTVLNNGYECPYRQLSGGERTLLKLCFNLPFMKMSENKAGIRFGTLMLDEPLRGLSDNYKDKAVDLLQSLEDEYGTVMLIEHYDAFQSSFPNVFKVTNTGGTSQVKKG